MGSLVVIPEGSLPCALYAFILSLFFNIFLKNNFSYTRLKGARKKDAQKLVAVFASRRFQIGLLPIVIDAVDCRRSLKVFLAK